MSSGGWGVKQTPCVHTGEYYPARKRNEALIHPTAWLTLMGIMLSEKSQSPKALTIWFTISLSLRDKMIETEIRLPGIRKGWGREDSMWLEKRHLRGQWVMKTSCVWTAPRSVPWMWSCVIVLQDVTIGGSGIKRGGGLPVLFLRAACESTIISKLKKFNLKKY